MTTTALRRITLGVVPAVLAVGALTGCNDSAPTVQAPTATSTTTEAAPTTDETTTEAPPTTDETTTTTESSPTTDETTETTEASGDPSAVCTENSSYGTPATVGSTTKKGKWGDALEMSREYGGTVSATAGKPEAKAPESDDYFIEEGQTYLAIDMTIKYKSGSSFIGGSFFALQDAKGNSCDTSLLSSVVPESKRFESGTVDENNKTLSGVLVFEVPKGQDYTKYTLTYLAPSQDSHDGAAQIAWTK